METAMTSNIPPKQTVTGSPGTPNPAFEQPYAGIPEQPGALVSIHNAALHATPDSFPVLKAFKTIWRPNGSVRAAGWFSYPPFSQFSSS